MFAVMLPPNVPDPPMLASNATPNPPLETTAPEPTLIDGVVLLEVIVPDDKIFPDTSNASVGFVLFIPTCL